MELKLYNTTSSKLNSLNIVGGQLIVSKDDSCLYVDIDSIGRLKITDWIELETDNDRLAVLAPISGKIYYVSETSAIWKYVKGSWKCLNEVNKEDIFEYVLENLQSYLDAKVPTSRKINGKALTSDIVLSAADVGATTQGYVDNQISSLGNTYYTETEIDSKIDDINESISKKSDSSHNHDDKYYTETEIDNKISELNTAIKKKSDDTHNHDNDYSSIGHKHTVSEVTDISSNYYNQTQINSKISTINNEINNKSDVGHGHSISEITNLQSSLNDKVSISRKINNKPLTSDITITASDIGALTESDIATVKTEVNNYTDKQIANLLNNSSEAVDSIYELRDAMEENADAIESLVSISGSKANASDLTSHLNNQSNPHNVTKEQLGLYVSTWSGTRAEYDVLTTKQDDCLYIITDESETTEFESISNKVTVINASSDDKHYPSAKAVYQVMQTIDGYEKTSNKDTVISIGSDDNHYPTSKAVYDNVNNTVNSAKETILQTLEKRVYGVEKQSNKVTEITEDAKHTTYPSSLAVLHAIETFGGTDIETTNTIDENSTADEVPNAKATYDFVKSEMNNINEIIQSQTSTVYSGTSEPDGSVGKVGDLWVVIE